MMTDKTLLEKMRINDIEIAHRMDLLDLTHEDLDRIAACKNMIESELEGIVEEFYGKQTEFDEISLLIGDSETLRRLRTAQRRYIVELFSGYYDGEYVNSRLRIGLVHKRIGVEPKLFLSGISTLKQILLHVLKRQMDTNEQYEQLASALDKLFYFDITLVFDTYIDTLLSEVESAKKRMESYAHALEEKTKLLGTYAERDSLTDLYNKRGMMNILKREMRMAQRRQTNLSIIYIDVNTFKYINDTFGHQKGDEILADVGRCMHESARGTDFCCRVGGDEFCVILPDCNEENARTLAGKIASEFSLSNPGFTVSTGVAETGTQEYLDEEALIHTADARMYKNKTGNSKEAREMLDDGFADSLKASAKPAE